MTIDKAVKTIYPLDCLSSLQGLNALRKLHALIEEHARFTTVREAQITVLNDVPVFLIYDLTPEEEALRKRMLQGSHGYWRNGGYHLTYSPKRRRKYGNSKSHRTTKA